MLNNHLDWPTGQGHTSPSLAAILGTIKLELAAWRAETVKIGKFHVMRKKWEKWGRFFREMEEVK